MSVFRRLISFPATGRSPVGHPDAFHWERVTGWSPDGGRLAHWNAPLIFIFGMFTVTAIFVRRIRCIVALMFCGGK